MNIAVIAHFQYDNSPYNIFVREQVKAYKALGHSVTVISPLTLFKKGVNDFAKDKKMNIVDDVKVFYPRHISLSNYGKYNLNNLFGFYAVDKVFGKLHKETPFDLIHANMIVFDGKIGAMLKEKYNVPLFITTHGSDTSMEIELGKGDYISNICKQADGVIAVSSKLKSELLNQDDNIDIKIIHNGFDRKNIVISEKAPQSLISVGNLKKQKGFDIGLKAFAKVKEKFQKASYTIVGDGAEKENLMNLAKELNIADSVTFTGRLENKDVLMEMSKADVFLLPSVREGFGIVYLEAMASGCLTIGTKGEGIADIIKDGYNGFLTTPRDENALADVIINVLSNEEQKNKISQNGKMTAMELTWEKNASEAISFFEKTLSQKSDFTSQEKEIAYAPQTV